MAHTVTFKVLRMGKEEAHLIDTESEGLTLQTTEILALI